jgi:hypothetical protein
LSCNSRGHPKGAEGAPLRAARRARGRATAALSRAGSSRGAGARFRRPSAIGAPAG